MRWLFLLLLVINIAYVAWELEREHVRETVPHMLPRGVERIALLGETKSDARDGDDTARPAVTGSTTAAVGQESIAESPDQAATSLQQTEAGKADIRAIEAASPETVAVVEEQAAETRDEMPVETPAEKTAQESGHQPPDDLCYTLGPFREMKTLRTVTREIRDYVVEVSFRSREEQEQTMFRVLLTPVGSKREARALIKELDSKNIRDHFIITEGSSKNAISLGYFSKKARAYRHAERVRKLGFDVVAEPVFSNYTIYWLDYRIKAGNEIPQRIIDDHLENSAQKLGRACS